MYRYLFVSILLVFSVNAIAQEFKQSVGFRAGLTSGFEYRIFSDDIDSYRFLLGTRDRGMLAHVLREFHKPDLFEFTDQLVFVYGAGIHAGYERWDEMYYSTIPVITEPALHLLPGSMVWPDWNIHFMKSPLHWVWK